MNDNGKAKEPTIIVTKGSNIENPLLAVLGRFWTNAAKDPIASLLFLLYIFIAMATFRHTAIGFASIEEGNVFWGAIAALAIDAGLMLTATGLRKKRHPLSTGALIFGLVASVFASAYTQLLYSVMHAKAIAVAPGAQWLGPTAIWIIQKRVVIMSALLPFLAVAYSFAAHSSHETVTTTKTAKTPKRTPQKRDKGTTVKDKCRAAWEEHGFEKTAQEIADLVGCHFTTANKVRQEMQKELEHA